MYHTSKNSISKLDAFLVDFIFAGLFGGNERFAKFQVIVSNMSGPKRHF